MNETPLLPPDSLAATNAPTPVRLSEPLGDEVTHVLPIIEERAIVRREITETGRVRITRQVHETDEQVNVPLQHEEVAVEHVSLNQTLPAGAQAPATRYEGDTLIIPVVREIVVVETRLLLVEELRVTKRHLTTQHTESVHLRREEISIEHLLTPPPTEATA